MAPETPAIEDEEMSSRRRSSVSSINRDGTDRRTMSLRGHFGSSNELFADGEVDVHVTVDDSMASASASTSTGPQSHRAAAQDPPRPPNTNEWHLSADENTTSGTPRANTSKPNMHKVWSAEWCDTRVVKVEDGENDNDGAQADGGDLNTNTDDSDDADGGDLNTNTDDSDDQSVSANVELPPAPLSQTKWMRRDSIPPHGPLTDPPTIDDMRSWTFDVLSYKQSALVPTFSRVLSYYDIPRKFSVDLDTLDNFSAYVMERHNPVAAYHNWHHGVSCMHMTFLLLSLGGADAHLTDANLFAVLFAALVHDVDHAGHNNDFEVKTATERAVKYGNDAVLENHSIAITYEEILTREGCDIFDGLKREGREEEVGDILDAAMDYILWTDPARHGTLLKSLAKRYDDANGKANNSEAALDQANALGHAHAAASMTALWNRDDPDSRSLLCRMIIHAADISNPVHSSFKVALDWCSRINTEFALQAAQESELGLEVTSFMDGLDDEYRVAKQQIGFYQWMAIPFFSMVAKMLQPAAAVERWAMDNKKKYEDIVARIDQYREEVEGSNSSTTTKANEESKGKD